MLLHWLALLSLAITIYFACELFVNAAQVGLVLNRILNEVVKDLARVLLHF